MASESPDKNRRGPVWTFLARSLHPVPGFANVPTYLALAAWLGLPIFLPIDGKEATVTRWLIFVSGSAVLFLVAGVKQEAELARAKVNAGVAPLSVRLEGQQPIHNTQFWLLRLTVHNENKRPGVFYAKVVELEGHFRPGPEVSWWIPWRQEKSRSHEILGEDSEMLLLGRLPLIDAATARKSAFERWRPGPVFWTSQHDGGALEDHQAYFADVASIDDLEDAAIHLVVNVWEGGTVVASSDVTLTLREQAGIPVLVAGLSASPRSLGAGGTR